MSRTTRLAAALVAVFGIAAGSAPAARAQGGVRVGTLTCRVAGSAGFVFGSSRGLDCVFAPSHRRRERYVGNISKFGVDIGYTPASVIVWGVIASTARLAPGSLAGSYAGATAGASVGAGLGANALIGGSNSQIALQPVSVEAKRGLNLAAGIASLTLNAVR